MIKNHHLLENLEKEFLLQEHLSLSEKLKILDELWKECISINSRIMEDYTEGIEKNIELARILNLCLKN